MAVSPIADIKEQIEAGFENALDAFGANFGANRVAKYPVKDFKSVINVIDPNSEDWKSSLGYEFQVMKEVKGKTISHPDWQALRLQINPQELNQDEIFAIKVTPTFKGILVEHQGITFQDITISGTTGVSPNRNVAGALSTGAPAFGKGHSGYAEFHELRNYFRAYAEAKRLPKGDNLILVFRNYKDREYLIVEPQRFAMKRSSSKATLYNYSIQIKAIGRADAPKKDDSYFLDDLFSSLDTAATFMKDAAAILAGFVEFLQQAKQDVLDAAFGPLNDIIEALESMKISGQKLIDVIRSTVEDCKKEWEDLENNLNDLLGKDNDTWNATQGRTPTLAGTKGRTSTHNELVILNAIQKIKRGASILLQSNDIFVEDVAASASNTENLFAGKISLPVPSAVKEVTIDGNDTIQSIAARELGDPDRFREIVQINNLKPPFISQEVPGGPIPSPQERVLIPGQKILIPQDDGRSELSPRGTIRNKDYNITKNLKESEKNLGVDIALTEDNDIAISNTGDMDLKAGFDNLAQAIYLKLFLKKGSLKRHGGIGTNLGIGEKATNASQLKREVEESISSDPRIDNIPFSLFNQDGNVTELKLILNVKDLDQPLPLPLRL